MNLTPFRGALTAWLLLFGGALAAQAPTPPPPPPPVDPELPEQLKQLKSMVADTKMAADFQAIGLIEKLTEKPEALHQKDQERLAKGLGDVFRGGKLRPKDKEILYLEVSDGLAKLGEDGAKELAKALADPRFKERQTLQAHMIVALGETQDEKQVDWILDELARSPHDEMRAAAGEALGKYKDMELKRRREVVKTMIRSWGSLHQKATQAENTDPNAPINPDPQNARQTLRLVEGKWVATLQKLTGVSQSTFPDWQRWLNKNGNWQPPAPPKQP